MKVITQNPYRQLGIFANASTKDRVAAIGKLKAFLKVGRQMESPFDKVLPAIERSVESVEEAEHQLTLPAEQMRYAQFWFVKATPIDEVAFNNLFAGNDVEAQNLWSKKLTASSLQNLIICKLLSEYYSEAIAFAEKLYSEHADEFVQLVNGDTAMTKNLAFDFLDTLCEAVGVANVMPYLTNDEWKGHLAEPIVNQLESLVDNAKSATKKNSSDGIKIGKRLLKDTNPLLKELKSAISNDIRYQMTADKVGNTVLQCAINCYNDSDDKQIARDALDLAKKAKSVVVSKLAKDRCDENIAILQKAVDHLPPEEVESESLDMLLILATAASSDEITIREAESILEEAIPHLKSMKSEFGERNQYYLEQSTMFVAMAMKAIYNELESAMASHTSSSSLSTILSSSWQLIQKIGKLDMTDEARERYKKDRSSLQRLKSGDSESKSDFKHGCLPSIIVGVIGMIIAELSSEQVGVAILFIAMFVLPPILIIYHHRYDD